MSIRPMSIGDYDDVYRLWVTTPGVGLSDVNDSRDGIARYLKRNPSTCFVAEEDGQLVGTILSGHDGRRGFIYHACVAQEARLTGLGRALVDAVLAALHEEGITKVALVVFGRNDGGNAFWERQGFITRPDIIYRNRSLVDT